MAATILDPVKVATTENIIISNGVTPGVTQIDGIIVNSGDRVLIKSQTNKIQNGIYLVGAAVGNIAPLTRSTDFNTAAESTLLSAQVFVQQGQLLEDTGWVVANDSAIIIGTSEITFVRFSVNSKILSDFSNYLVLRQEKGYPLTNTELDNNFKYIANEILKKVDQTEYEPLDISEKLNTLSAAQALLNAWTVRDMAPSQTSLPDTIVARNSTSDVYANIFFGDLEGIASNATLADYATLASNVNGIVLIANGGTGANSADGARANIGAVNIAGDTMTGKLVISNSNSALSGVMRIRPGIAPASFENGDLWADSSNIYYRLNSKTETFAKLDSPNFIGAPTAPTAETSSNSTALATTEFVQNVRNLLQNNINLKADNSSPSLTGIPQSSTIGNTTDNSNRIATTTFVQDIRNILQGDINSRALSSNVYTKTEVNNFFIPYSTTSEMNVSISSAIASERNSYQDKWGSSKKFVQSTDPGNAAVNGDFWFKI